MKCDTIYHQIKTFDEIATLNSIMDHIEISCPALHSSLYDNLPNFTKELYKEAKSLKKVDLIDPSTGSHFQKPRKIITLKKNKK
jgi:hypothetical protein